MAFATEMRRFSSSSSLLARFLNRSPSPAASAMVTLPFSSSSNSSIADLNEEICIINTHGGSFSRLEEFPVQRGIQDPHMENPIQISGPRGAYEVKKVDEGLFVRMDMPGIDKEDVKVWVEYGNVMVKGEGNKESKHEVIGRAYSARVEVSTNSFQSENTKVELKNGVLRMLIPKTEKFGLTGKSSLLD